jgi:hypothetical protein
VNDAKKEKHQNGSDGKQHYSFHYGILSISER